MDVEYGRLDFDVNQIDAVLDLDGTQTYQARSREGMNDTVKNSAAVGGVLDNKSRSTSNSIDKLSLRTVRWAKALVGKAKGSEQAEPTVDLHKVAPSAGVSAPVSVSARSPFAGMDEWWRQLAANVQQGKWAAGGQL